MAGKKGMLKRGTYTHCTVDGCTAVHRAKGLCHNHYSQEFKKKAPKPPGLVKAKRSCAVVDCDRPFLARSVCDVHYFAIHRKGAQYDLVPNHDHCDQCNAEVNILYKEPEGAVPSFRVCKACGDRTLAMIKEQDPGFYDRQIT